MPELVKHFTGGRFVWRFEDDAEASPLERRTSAPSTSGLRLNPFTGSWSIDPDAPTSPPAQMVEVSNAGVAQWRKDAVSDVLGAIRSTAVLELPPDLEIKWFRPETDFQREMRAAGRGLKTRAPIGDLDDSVAGFVDTHDHKTIWLRSDAEELELAESVGHELFHSQTLDRALDGEPVDLDDEQEATRFGREVRRSFEAVEAELEEHVRQQRDQRALEAKHGARRR